MITEGQPSMNLPSPGKYDSPGRNLTVTLVVSALCVAAVWWVEVAVAVEDALVLLVLPFACGGILFGVYVPAAARWSRAVSSEATAFLRLFGLSFVVWGAVLALFYGGFLGIVHAIACTAVLGLAVGDWRVAVAPLPALIPAWVTAGFFFPIIESAEAGLASTMVAPIVVWNLEMAAVFIAWSAWRRRHPRPNPPRLCAVCRYDLTGLPESVCPECGESFAPSGE